MDSNSFSYEFHVEKEMSIGYNLFSSSRKNSSPKPEKRFFQLNDSPGSLGGGMNYDKEE
jgi:hypothetical protein